MDYDLEIIRSLLRARAAEVGEALLGTPTSAVAANCDGGGVAASRWPSPGRGPASGAITKPERAATFSRW